MEQNTEQRLLIAAKQEFLKHGFEKASLRRICTNTNLSTGAVYFFFASKEELFCRLVQKTTEQMEELAAQLLAIEWNSPDAGVENDMRLIEFLYHHRDEMQLLLEKANGTRYEGFRQELLQRMEKIFLRFFQKFGAPEVEPVLIRLITQMRFGSYLELLNGGYSMEHMLQLSRQLGIYADGGFQSLTAALKQNQGV